MSNLDLFKEVKDRISESLEIIKRYEPPEGYYVAFSGGKDSMVLLDLGYLGGIMELVDIRTNSREY